MARAGRVAPALRVLAVTVTLLLLVDPMLVHALGFRLSLAATAGLVVLTRPIERRLPGPHWLRLPLAVTLAAQLATAPLLIGLNGGMSPAAVPANLAAVPAAGLVMMLGVTLGVLAGLMAEPIAAVLQLPARGLVAWIDAVAGQAATFPCASLGPARLVALVAVVAGWAGARSRVGVRPRRLLAVAAAALVVAVCWPTTSTAGHGEPAEGLTVVIGSCGGGVVVQLDGAVDEADTLDALRAGAVRRIDVLVVGRGRTAHRVATSVVEQWPVRRREDLAEGASAALRVGGVDIGIDGTLATIELSRAACRCNPHAPPGECPPESRMFQQ